MSNNQEQKLFRLWAENLNNCGHQEIEACHCDVLNWLYGHLSLPEIIKLMEADGVSKEEIENAISG